MNVVIYHINLTLSQIWSQQMHNEKHESIKNKPPSHGCNSLLLHRQDDFSISSLSDWSCFPHNFVLRKAWSINEAELWKNHLAYEAKGISYGLFKWMLTMPISNPTSRWVPNTILWYRRSAQSVITPLLPKKKWKWKKKSSKVGLSQFGPVW